MNSIITAKLISEQYPLWGKDWFYEFRELRTRTNEDAAKKIIARLEEQFSKITRDWTKEINSEWICRVYAAAKMIWTATLNLNAMEYAAKRNLRIVVPYLRYYALLSLGRGIAYTLPHIEWKNGDLLAISHAGVKRTLEEHIKKFDANYAEYIADLFSTLKAERELISYKAPSSGDRGLGNDNDLDWVFSYLADIIQLNSEIMERSIIKNTNEDSHVFLRKYIDLLSNITIEGRTFSDKEDAYRLGYLGRKYPMPPNVRHIMTEGHVEDFFGAWCDEDGCENVFNPDIDWQKIFDVP